MLVLSCVACFSLHRCRPVFLGAVRVPRRQRNRTRCALVVLSLILMRVQGASYDALQVGETALFIAAFNDCEDAAQVLIDMGAYVNARCSNVRG